MPKPKDDAATTSAPSTDANADELHAILEPIVAQFRAVAAAFDARFDELSQRMGAHGAAVDDCKADMVGLARAVDARLRAIEDAEPTESVLQPGEPPKIECPVCEAVTGQPCFPKPHPQRKAYMGADKPAAPRGKPRTAAPIECPVCEATEGQPCYFGPGKTGTHTERRRIA